MLSENRWTDSHWKMAFGIESYKLGTYRMKSSDWDQEWALSLLLMWLRSLPYHRQTCCPSLQRIPRRDVTLELELLELLNSPTVTQKNPASSFNNSSAAFCSSLFLAAAPDFSKNPVKKTSVVQVGGEVTIGCRPSASPRAAIDWRKGPEVLRLNKRYCNKAAAGLLGVLCFNII